MGKKKNKKHTKKASHSNKKKQQNTPAAQEENQNISTNSPTQSNNDQAKQIANPKESVEQYTMQSSAPYMTRVEKTIDNATGEIIEKSATPYAENQTINSANTQQHAPINTNSDLPPNARRVKETKDAHPGYKSFTDYYFETYNSNNYPLDESPNIADKQPAKTDIISTDTNTKKSYPIYNFLDNRSMIRYDHNGVLHIYNQPIFPPYNTQNSVEQSTLNNENTNPFEELKDNLAFTPLNCYENFISNIKLLKEYKTTKEIVENFEELFKPQTFGNNLVIWENGVDKLLFIDQLKSFIKEQFFLSFSSMEKPAPEVKKCCETILFNMKTKYKKYPSAVSHHVLCKNGHFDIHYDFSSDNPKILPSNYDIDNIRCRYRINVNLKLPKDDPQFSMSDFLSLSPIKPLEFDKFVCSISNGIPAIMYRVWEMIGSLLVPDNKCRAIFLLQGEPSSGKSILGKIISRLFDSKYVSNLNMSQLGNNAAAKALIDKQLNISLDLPNDVIPPAAISFLKQMTGGDLDSFSIDENSNNTFGHCKFLFATNHPLTIKGVDTAFAERIVCIPFFKSVPKQMQDSNLYEKLEKELDYIATKAMFFYRLLVRSNYVYSLHDYLPYKANITTLSCIGDEDNFIVKNFATACCVFGPYKIYTYELYNEYLQYCRFNNIIPIEKPNAFSRVFKKCFDSCITSAKWRSNNNSAFNGFRGVTITQFLRTEKYQSDDDYSNYSMNQPPSNPYNTTYDNNIDDLTNTLK